MNRFSIFEIPSTKNRTTTWEEYVEKYAKGYESIGDPGDDKDYLLVDHEDKTYSWAEYGDISADANQEEIGEFFPIRVTFEEFIEFQKAQIELMKFENGQNNKFEDVKFSLFNWECIKNEYAKSYFE
jgi:hypothetical protein